MSFAPVVRTMLDAALAAPQRCAVEEPGRHLSYGELLARARAVQGHLMRQGVGPGSVVGLALPRSADYVIALLGIWLSGAAFLPLPPELPAARRARMLREARAARVIGLGGLDANLRDAGELCEPGPVATAASDLAYVIYTSGSSGTPKGVAVLHGGLPLLVRAQIAAFELDSSSRVLWLHSTAFDAHVSDVATALCAGATLVIDDVGSWLDRVQRHQISHVDVPPVLLRLSAPEHAPPCLTTLVVGGEPSPPQVLRAWARTRRVVGVYGPTEATVCSSLCVIDADAWQRPLLGQPLAGTHYAVVDEAGENADEGELYIGGAQLALGYLGDPELTRARFVERAGQRWYRSGDRVRRVGADFEFLGRIDRQLSVNGVRVEPSEIEAALCALPGVQEAAVVQRRVGASARGVLSATLCPETLDVAAIEVAVAKVLPPWLCPRHYRCVRRLPRLTSGKVDYAALTQVHAAASGAGDTLGAPRQNGQAATREPLAQELSAMWRAVLSVGSAGSGDDFFALGGDSLAVVELAVLAQSRGLALSAAAITAHPEFAAQLGVLRSGAQGDRRSARALRKEAARWVSELPPRGAASMAPGSDPARAAWLVTGATGSVGAHVLAELLGRTTGPIACVVRAADEGVGKARLERALSATGLSCGDEPLARLRVVVGDVAVPYFGLSERRYAALAREIQAVFHCAGRVHAVESYERLRSANVLGTLEALRFCRSAMPKVFHHVSTLSVFVSTDRATGSFSADDALEATRWVRGGYAQSKWVAEQLVRSAPPAGPQAIYRLGLITPHSATGRGTATDQLGHLIRGLARLGAVPRGLGALAFDVTPVDVAAQILAELLLRPGTGTQTFHIANQTSATLDMLVDALSQCGVALRELDAADWQGLAARAYTDSG
ncbi:MAG TPA: non-ribosomal peptide synthetase, partial [Polyangiaceae bacterium]|nr:non-ribosomal peptide synthetase [Polyangiaceae bacterium]